MKTYKKTFDFYATDVELDTYVYDILTGPDYDPDAQIEVSIDRDIDHRYVTLKIFDRVLNTIFRLELNKLKQKKNTRKILF